MSFLQLAPPSSPPFTLGIAVGTEEEQEEWYVERLPPDPLLDEPMAKIATDPLVKASLEDGDPMMLYYALAPIVGEGVIGRTMLELIRRVPDWDRRLERRFPDLARLRRISLERFKHPDGYLTENEHEAVHLLNLGLDYKGISAELDISMIAVRTRIERARRRLRARTDAEMLDKAAELGLFG